MQKQKREWILYRKGDRISRDAFSMRDARGDRPVYVARLLHQGHLLPGYACSGVGYFVHKGQVVTADSHFEILHGEYTWVHASFFDEGQRAAHAIKAGCTFMGVTTYVGMAFVDQLQLCGQIIGDFCHIAVCKTQIRATNKFSYLVNCNDGSIENRDSDPDTQSD